MLPVLFSIGPFHIFSFSVFLILSWLTFSFLFWKALRGAGIEEDKIFDLTFYSTIVALATSRLWYVALHVAEFSDNWLKVAAIWVAPGLSFYGALLGGIATLLALARAYKVRVGYLLDGLAVTLPGAMLVGTIGSFLDGTVIGREVAGIPWAVRYVGHPGLRHPVQLYEALVLVCIIGILALLAKRATAKKWPYGVLGLWFFLLLSVAMFALEFTKVSRVYWQHVSANQWILLAIWCEALGAFYVRGGGREKVRPLWYATRGYISKTIGGIYGAVRHPKKT